MSAVYVSNTLHCYISAQLCVQVLSRIKPTKIPATHFVIFILHGTSKHNGCGLEQNVYQMQTTTGDQGKMQHNLEAIVQDGCVFL